MVNVQTVKMVGYTKLEMIGKEVEMLLLNKNSDWWELVKNYSQNEKMEPQLMLKNVKAVGINDYVSKPSDEWFLYTKIFELLWC